MRIAIIMPLATVRGGAELMLLDLLRHGRGASIQWHVIFLEEGPMVADVQALGVPAEVIPAGQLRQAHRYLPVVRRIAATVRQTNADAVLGWMAKSHLYGHLVARFAGVPAFWYHVGVFSQRDWLDQVTARLPAHGAITLCTSCAQALVRIRPARQVKLVRPGVDLSRFDPDALPPTAEARRRLGLLAQGKIIGLVGRLQRWKGIHVLVEAMPRVLKAYPDVHCVIVGGEHDLERDYPALIRRRIVELGLTKKVTLAGFQSDVPLWMQAMDIVVHASDNEPFGLVVVEAMALGKPVVAANSGGPVEVITDGRNGLLTAYGDADAVASALLLCLDAPAFAANLGAAARLRARDFSAPGYAHNLVRVLQDMAQGNEAIQEAAA